MKKLIIFLFLFCNLRAILFRLKYYMNDGICGIVGEMLVGDIDRDSLYEIAFPSCEYFKVVLYEQVVSDSILFGSPIFLFPTNHTSVWLLGDFDQDGLYDITGQNGGGNTPESSWVGISIFEQPDSFSYPTVEIYRDTTYTGAQTGMTGGDVDGDGIPEILKSTGSAVLIFESRGNNAFERTFEAWPPPPHDIDAIGTHAIGDFDGDGKNEFVVGGGYWHFLVFEAVDNDIYQFTWVSPQIPTTNLYDIRTLPDLDKDGKPEFMVKGWTSDGRTTCLIYEAVANDTYDIIWDTVYTGQYHGTGLSDVGDVDMDGEPELVLNTGNGFRVLKAIGDNQFKDIGGRTVGWGTYSIANITIAPDIDRNGINEIITSAGNDTRFYEAIITSVSEKLKISKAIKIPSFLTQKNLYLLNKNFKIFKITGRKISPLRIEKSGIYFIYLKEKTFKIINIK